MSKFSDLFEAMKISDLMQKKDNFVNRKNEILEKADEMISLAKVNGLLDKREEEKQKKSILWIFAIIGGVAVLVAACYAVYRFFTPDAEEWEEYPDEEYNSKPEAEEISEEAEDVSEEVDEEAAENQEEE